MSEQNLPDEELNVVGEDGGIPDAGVDSLAPEALDPVNGTPDDYPGAAENSPDAWQEDPLLQDDPAAGAGSEGGLSDQALREETEEERYREGSEQVPPEEPTIGEAAADVDFGDRMDSGEVDASDDGANFGGSPLSQFEPEDLDR
jgi:hypothetical protein